MGSKLKKTLSGSCFCGRNKYTIAPQDFPNPPPYGPPPYVYYDNCGDCRHAQAAPIVAYIRIPITWTSFTTHPKSADEKDILKIYASSPLVERKFCGYCGTQMSWWKKGDEEEYIDITLGTLVDEDLNALEELGLTPEMHFHWEGGLKWFQRQYKDSKMGEWMKVKKADFTELVEEGKAFE